MPIKRFVIFAAPRTGSNLLCTLLNSHPRILCHHEVFNPRGIFYAIDRRDGSFDLGSMVERDRAPADFLDRLWRETEGATHVGFKMTRGQQEDILRLVLNDDTVQKIVLSRTNRIRTYLSHLIAEYTDQWEVYDETELVGDMPRFNIDAGELEAHAQINAAFYADLKSVLASSGQSWLEVLYQDLMSRTTHERLLAYLGADSATLEAGSIRQNGRDLEALIDNFDELATTLEATDFCKELNELEEMAEDG